MTGMPANRRGADGNLITPEKAELYHSPVTTKEIEPGYGPNPSWSSDPSDSTAAERQDGRIEEQNE